ncbi:MAG: ABC transporter ATP-binding protein [Flexilinea sp.]|nr:ABC transporter ATP-binding protein [Flexilinea sp.]
MKLQGHLDNSNIEELLRTAERELERVGIEKEDRIRFRLSAEELLLEYASNSEAYADFSLYIHKKGGSEQVELCIRGKEKNLLPNANGGEQNINEIPSPILLRTLAGWEFAPNWRYESGQNIYQYSLPMPKSVWGNLRFTWNITKKHQSKLFLAIGAQLVTVVMSVVAPVVSARVIKAYASGAVQQIILTALALMVIGIISDFFSAGCNYLYNVVYNRTLTDLDNKLVNAVLRITSSCLDEKGTGLFIQRLTVDTSTLATGFNTMADLISQMFTYIGILAAILIVSPPVFAAAVVLLALQILIERHRTRKRTADDRIFRNASERFTGFVGEMVRGARDVKLMHRESTFEQELDKRIGEANNSRMTRDVRSWKYKLLRMSVGRAGSYAFAALLALLLSQKQIEPADTLVLYNYYSRLDISAVLILGQLLEFFKDFNLCNERVRAIVESREFPKEQFGSVHIPEFHGDISFDHVYFSYDNGPRHARKYVIRDMSFHVPAGQTVALVGHSGCGKSSAFNLISKLYMADKGVVSLDGVDIKTLDADTIRGNIAVVNQNPYLFHMSIRDNLRLARTDLTEEDMRNACALACIDEDIQAMPDGYDSIIGEGGVNLSGGQRQRLAIARAILKKYRILLLDEATSALDNTTQAKIQASIEKIRGENTIFIIAHRLSTIVNADKIIYMENGKVLDEGTHQELLSRCAPYRALYDAEQGLKTQTA